MNTRTSKVIRVSDEVFNKLKASKGGVESVDAVLRRILKLKPSSKKTRGKSYWHD